MVLICGKCGSSKEAGLYKTNSDNLACLCKKCYQAWRDTGSLWARRNDDPYIWLETLSNMYPTKSDMEQLYETVKSKLSDPSGRSEEAKGQRLRAPNTELMNKWKSNLEPEEAKNWIDSNFNGPNDSDDVKYLISQIVWCIIEDSKKLDNSNR